MAARLRARNVILVSGAVMVPLSVVMLIVTMVVWKFNRDLPSDIWASALLHPFLSAGLLLLALWIHRQGGYMLSMALALLPIFNLGFFVFRFVTWG